MKPEDLSPAQAMQLVALGLILLSLLAASVAAWGILLFRLSKGLGFRVASKPTASVGFIDFLIGFLAIVFCFALAITTWRLFISPAPIAAVVSGSQTDIEPEQKKTDSQIDSSSSTGETEESTLPASAEVESNGNEDSPIEKPKGSKDEKKSTITKEEVLGSGWVSVFQLIAAFITMVIVAGRIGWDWRALGLSSTGVLRDIGIGFWVLLLMLPPIFMINIACSLASGVEYSHPIVDAIKNYPWLVGVVAFQAVIVAPITEEFLFRGLLTGWFESAHFGRTANAILFGWKPNPSPAEELALEPAYRGGRDDKASPYSSPTVLETGASETAGPYSPPWWPAILSGVLFGLAHFSYGVSWVPLIVFGIIMGRVYQLRQSLVMCIAVHMLFNGINILNLWLSLGLPTQK
ncbi:MAG: lysostaphin resistance A-like protein [Pirellula sp.]|jgi:membrane protease YdiL (CAAX protease family)